MTYAWAKPGAKVVCVDDDWPGGAWYGWESLPRRGEVYTVREVLEISGRSGVRLEEIWNSPADYSHGFIEAAFAADRFRPLVTRTQEQDVALFAPLLSTKTVDELVGA